MLEEKNDNLHNADGSENEGINASQPLVPGLNPEVPESTDEQEDISAVRETEGQIFQYREDDVVEEPSAEAHQEAAAPVAVDSIESAMIAEAEEAPSRSDDTAQNAVEAIESSNAEAGEEEEEHHDIPMQNYEELSMEQLAAELETLAANDNITQVKNHIEEIRKEFYSKYNHLIEEKKDEYSHENNGDTSGFEYHFPLKAKFDAAYNKFRDRKNSHFKKLQNDLQGNLEKRVAIIDELKNIIDSGESINDALKHVNDLRERWKNAGPIPRDKYNHVWNNFHFHIERFYDHLHLDREARDMDFKHNLEKKQGIIARVEELVNEPDINKAFRELQGLHKMWKEEIGPVSREHRESIWERFSELTKQLHDRREAQQAEARGREEENLAKRKKL
ncbi:DUF349 domain-containing protein [Flavobacterium sp. J372]|uniref:DUF349 domain-containing protein n=1 Tax=Flavobacterium sp. J372 TaxID=2898436 RepID=UPI0027E2233D|nr:DUF349 domain-containing protein [Flavobacterium sp. J372]